MISLVSTYTEIRNTLFKNNIASSITNGVSLINSYIFADNITVDYDNEKFISQVSTADAGFFNLNFFSVIFLWNSVLKNCRGRIAALVYATGQSSMFLYDIIIFNNYSPSGPLFHLLLTEIVEIKNTIFESNPEVNLKVDSASISVYNSTFKNAGT